MSVSGILVIDILSLTLYRYWFSDLAGESLQYLKIFYGWLSRQLDDDAVNYQGNSSRSVVIGAALELYSRHRKNVSGSLDRELQTIDMLRQRHLEDLLENCNSSQDKLLDRRCRHSLGVALEYMVPYSDLLCIHPELRESTLLSPCFYNYYPADFSVFASLKGSIGRFMNMSMSQKEGPRALTSDYLEIRLARLEYALGKYDHSLNSCFTKTPETVRDSQYNVSPGQSKPSFWKTEFADVGNQYIIRRRNELCYDIFEKMWKRWDSSRRISYSMVSHKLDK